jgi:hypothetical protein
MKNIKKTRQAIKQLLEEIPKEDFSFLEKYGFDFLQPNTGINKSFQLGNSYKRKAYYLEFARKAVKPVCEKFFYSKINKGVPPSDAIENKHKKYKTRHAII